MASIRNFVIDSLTRVVNNLLIKNVTWSELVNLRDTSMLIKGSKYRITDYQTTTIQTNTISAGHQFDIIVTAEDVNKLSEEAHVIAHANDTYFTNSKLEAWKIWYCLDNDTTRFAWTGDGVIAIVANGLFSSRSVSEDTTHSNVSYYAWRNDEYLYYTLSDQPSVGDDVYDDSFVVDTQITECVSGKGVIYRMIDEWGNDCPYDFKNIMFKRKISLTYGYPRLDLTSGTDTWVFTFAATSHHISDNIWSDLKDGSLESPYGHESDENTSTFHDNVMGKYIKLYDNVDEDYTKYGKQYLNDNVFFGYWEEIGSDDPGNIPYYYAHCSYGCKFGINCFENTFGYDCYSNIFGDNCCFNTFGNICSINTFGNYCGNNTFNDNCNNNIFGNSCYRNTFGNNYQNNTFGNNCFNNTFGVSCSSNIFMNDCYRNTFGNNYQHNTFGNSCYFNTFGNNCYFNTFGNNCISITFGNNCYSNIFGDDCNNIKFGTASTVKSYCSHNIIENGNKCIYIDVTGTTSSNSLYRNVKIVQGVNNTGTYKTIADNNVNQTFQTVYQPANSKVISV